MSITNSLTERTQAGGRTIEKTQEIAAGSAISVDESIADGGNNVAVSFALDVSACKQITILATGGDILLETNSGSSPANTMSLLDGVPYNWHSGSYHAFLLTTDVTGLFFTNASGAAVRVQIEALSDPTP